MSTSLAPRCPHCRKPHLPELRCWRGRYAMGVTRHILTTQGRRCWACGGPATSADHMVPRSRGGTDVDANLRPACIRHNSGRGNKDPATVFEGQPVTPLDQTRLSARWRNLPP